jgi:hypothetical protein
MIVALQAKHQPLPAVSRRNEMGPPLARQDNGHRTNRPIYEIRFIDGGLAESRHCAEGHNKSDLTKAEVSQLIKAVLRGRFLKKWLSRMKQCTDD